MNRASIALSISLFLAAGCQTIEANQAVESEQSVDLPRPRIDGITTPHCLAVPYKGTKTIEIDGYDASNVTTSYWSRGEVTASNKNFAYNAEFIGSESATLLGDKVTRVSTILRTIPPETGQEMDLPLTITTVYDRKLQPLSMAMDGGNEISKEFVDSFGGKNNLRNFVPISTTLAVGDAYFLSEFSLDIEGIPIDLSMKSIVDGVATVRGRETLVIRLTTYGRVAKGNDTLTISSSGYTCIDLKTGAIAASESKYSLAFMIQGKKGIITTQSEMNTELPYGSTTPISEPSDAKPTKNPQRTVADRLRDLKQLFEDDLITQAEYNAKRQALLDQF